jgi:hypothetical protein
MVLSGWFGFRPLPNLVLSDPLPRVEDDGNKEQSRSEDDDPEDQDDQRADEEQRASGSLDVSRLLREYAVHGVLLSRGPGEVRPL